jgi:hypothetical protein
MAEITVGMRWVVPALWKRVRRPVENHPSLDHDQAADVGLDRPELVRDIQDRHPELAAKPVEEGRKCLLRRGVHAGGRLIQDEELRFAGEQLRDARRWSALRAGVNSEA